MSRKKKETTEKAPGQVANPTVPLPKTFKHLKPAGFKAQRYDHTINLSGPGLSTQIMDEIIGKQNNNESVVIVITATPGKGKTYLGLRWGQKLDPKFHINDTPPPDPKEDDGNVTFDREHIQYLVGGNSPLERTQVILMDEFHFGGGARSWQNKDQQKLVNLISAIRSKGFVLIIVVLNTKMVDVYVRDFVLNYQFAVTGRGKAIAYRRWFPEGANEAHRKRLGVMDMRLPDQDLCDSPDCFKCKWLHASKDKRCETIRAIYERRKKWFLDEQSQEDTEDPLMPFEADKKTVSDKIYEYQDMLHLTIRNTVSASSITNILKRINREDKIKTPYGRDAGNDWKRILDKDKELIKNIALREHPPKEYPEDSLLA